MRSYKDWVRIISGWIIFALMAGIGIWVMVETVKNPQKPILWGYLFLWYQDTFFICAWTLSEIWRGKWKEMWNLVGIYKKEPVFVRFVAVTMILSVTATSIISIPIYIGLPQDKPLAQLGDIFYFLMTILMICCWVKSGYIDILSGFVSSLSRDILSRLTNILNLL
jgi:hypothetical protein